MQSVNQLLNDAITKRCLVMFEYGDLIRVVEPHRYGVNSAGNPVLSGWLRPGYSRSDPAGGWRNYLLRDIRFLQVLDAPFAGARPGYAAHDPRMREVYAELPLVPDDVRAPALETSAYELPSLHESALGGSHTVPEEAARTRDGEIDPPAAVS